MTPVITAKRSLGTAVAAAAALMLLFTAASAAQTGGQPNALQGFSQNRKEPIKIASDSLEVRDKEKIATFIDNVRVVQGDTTLECKRLVVHYDNAEPAPQPASIRKPPTSSPTGGSQSIRKLEAHGGVVVTQKDQTAVGDRAVYDMKSNSVVLIGNVVITQGPNVIRGERLSVDLVTGVSRVEGDRVDAVFQPGATPSAPAPSPVRPPPTKPRNTTPSGAQNRTPSDGSERNRPRQTGQPYKIH